MYTPIEMYLAIHITCMRTYTPTVRSQNQRSQVQTLGGYMYLLWTCIHPLISLIEAHTLLQRHTTQHCRGNILYVQHIEINNRWNLGPMHQRIYPIRVHCVRKIKLNAWASSQWCRKVVDTHWSQTINLSWSLKFNDKGIIYNELLTLSRYHEQEI